MAPSLEPTADSAIEKVIDGSTSMILYWAAKAENTKAGEGVRATASATEVHKIGFRTLDSNMGCLTELLDGVGIGQDKITLEKGILHVISTLALDRRSLAISADVEQWSPSQDRGEVAQFHTMPASSYSHYTNFGDLNTNSQRMCLY